MAISLIKEPKKYQPAYNAIEFTFESDNSNQCEFVYIADLYVNGLFAIRLKSFPEGTDRQGKFEIKKIIQDYLSFNFSPKTSVFTPGSKSICSYYIEVREKYNTTSDCTGLPTLQSVDYTSDLKYSWNGALQYHEYPSYNDDKFVLKNTLSRFLTNSPDQLKLKLTEYSTLSFIQDVSNPVYKMNIRTYNYLGALIGDYFINNTYTTPTVPQLFLTIGVGPKNLNNSTLGVIIDSSVSYYEVLMMEASDVPVSETRKFYISTKCSPFRKFHMYWLSRLGGFDRITFDAKSYRSVPVNKSIYTNVLKSNYDIGDRGDSVSSVNAKDNYKANSDWITEPEGIWIEELFTNPEAYAVELNEISGTAPISGAFCDLPDLPLIIPIVGAVRDAGTGTASLYVTEPFPGSIPDGTFFDYTGTNFTAIGAANSGTNQMIVAFDSIFGIYETDIPATINAGALISGTLMPDGGALPAVYLNILSNTLLPDGTTFEYTVTGGGAIGMPSSGTGTVLAYDSDTNTYKTDINCTTEAGAIINGTVNYRGTLEKLIPIVINSTEYEEKLKKNIKNIQYNIEFSPSYKKNIQSF